MRTKPSLDFRDAETIAAACLAAARAIGVNMSIAVVDEAGALLHVQRMDGARAYSTDLAIRKARTAAAVGVPTRILEERFRDRPIQGQAMLALAGGAPATVDRACAGAVGVSGGTGEQDEAVVEAGLGAL
jgi:uncharacterized protein GlcG (DUF336 family)